MAETERELDLIEQSGLFDRAWYLAEYPDVAAAGIDALEHYVRYGALLRRNPSPAFDANHYLDSNQDVAQAGLNPLLHYLLYGRQEGRAAAPCNGAATDHGHGIPVHVPARDASPLAPEAWDPNGQDAAAREIAALRAANERLSAQVADQADELESNRLQLRDLQEELETWFRRYLELKEKLDASAAPQSQPAAGRAGE